MKFLLALLILTLLATPALSLVRLTYSWTAPTIGAPVEYYACETRWLNEDWSACSGTSSTTMLTIETFDGVLDFQLRVAGVDSMGRQGPWSEPSDPYNDLGSPGSPGKPSLQDVVHIGED